MGLGLGLGLGLAALLPAGSGWAISLRKSLALCTAMSVLRLRQPSVMNCRIHCGSLSRLSARLYLRGGARGCKGVQGVVRA